VQFITGIILAMHYSPDTLQAFASIEHILRDGAGKYPILGPRIQRAGRWQRLVPRLGSTLRKVIRNCALKRTGTIEPLRCAGVATTSS
jgi:hypothetical protein